MTIATTVIRTLITSFFGTLGFAFILQAPKRAWLPASFIGGASYALYIALMAFDWPAAAAMFVSAFAGAMSAQWCARKMRMIATIFVTLSIVSLVPGLGLYRCMEHLGAGRNALSIQTGVAAMIDILMIALAIGVSGFIFRAISARRR